MEASIRKENDHQVTLILDGRLDTSVTQETELEVEPLFEPTVVILLSRVCRIKCMTCL